MLTRNFRTAALAAAASGLILASPASALPITHSADWANTPAYGTMTAAYDDDDDDRRWGRQDRYERRAERRYDRQQRRYERQQRRYYGERVNHNTRAWRGDDGRYYCRKSDGTTGLLIGGAAGALLGREVAGRGDRTLGAILGAAGGALLGKSIDSGTRCD